MTYFLKNGNTFRVSSKDAMDLHDLLPAGNYVVKQDDQGRFFLETIASFTHPPKIYGDCMRNTDRIINSFMARESSTGVMLTGEKGSGKTLLSKNISRTLAAQGIPTIVINSPFHGDAFNTLLQSIEQPAMVLFDEFEKVYDSNEQEHILTLLDGVYPSKKLFILTCNDKWRVDQHMRNRPGRIFYMIDFKGLSAEFIREYCEDNLHNKAHIDTLCNIAGMFSQFNFDMLKAVVEDMNRYNESPQDALRILNVKPEFDGGAEYTVQLFYKGAEVPNANMSPTEWEGNPLQRVIHLSFDLNPQDESSEWEDVIVNSDNLVKVDAKLGKFVFETQDSRVVLVRKKEKQFNFHAF